MREVARRFLARAGVEVAAAPFDRLGDVERRARRRALEEHVLDEVGDAGECGVFVARAGGDEEAEGDGFGFAGDEDGPEAVAEGLELGFHKWRVLYQNRQKRQSPGRQVSGIQFADQNFFSNTPLRAEGKV